MKPLTLGQTFPNIFAAFLLLSACSQRLEGEIKPAPESTSSSQPTSMEIAVQTPEEAPLPSPTSAVQEHAPEVSATTEEKPEALPEAQEAPAAAVTPLPSRAATGKNGVPQIPQGAFSFVLDAGGYHLVLHDEPREEWGTGEPWLVFSGEMIVVRREIDLSRVSPLYGSWLGQKFQLYTKDTPICEATVKGFALVGRAYPDEILEAKLKDFDGTEKSLAALSKKAWEFTGKEGQRFLTAELAPTQGRCTGAVWARDVTLPVPRMAHAVPAGGPLKEAALAAFRSLPAYLAIQEEYNMSPDAEPGISWEEFEGIDPTVLAFQEPNTGALLLSVSASAGYSCGFFEGSLWAVWQVVGDPSRPNLRLLGNPSDSVYSVPEVALDLDADGQWEFIEEQWLIRKLGKSFDTWTEVEELYSPYEEEECGC